MESYEQITYRVETGDAGKFAVVSLNRPELRNCVSRIMTNELDRAFQRACDDTEVRVIVLRAEGSHFSSGHDLGSQSHLDDLKARPYEPHVDGDYEKWSELDVEMCLKWRQLKKPLICGLKGYTIYHGCALASCCDLAIATDDLHMMPSLVEYSSLPWDLALNTRRAKEIMFLQRFILANEALELGLVNRVIKSEPAELLDQELLRMANQIAKADPFHLRMMKLTANQAQDAAGFTGSIRSALSHWTSWRWAWESKLPADTKTADHGGSSKRLAPVKQALEEDSLYWSRGANHRAKL
jgi:enoyl-CoA hydratase